MKLYLAESGHLIQSYLKECIMGGIPKGLKLYMLGSFYYINDNFIKILPYLDDVLIDSGAFTFMQNKKTTNIDWEDYVERYGNFIKKYKIKKYFELDIDKIVGYEEVKRLRKKLEDIVGWKCIPVFHRSRGKEEFLKLIKEYDYIALGGIAIKDIKRNEYKYFKWFIDEAHKNNCKIHGLGFTNLEGIKKFHFDSVDSTSWTTGNRFGAVYKFNGKTVIKYDKPKGTRVKAREVAINNFIEWVKFSNYADKHL